MVMQFQELENPVHSSPCHSRTPSGFVMEMMGMKPAKGRTLLPAALGRAPATGPRKRGRLGFEMTVTDLCQRWLSQNQKTGVRRGGGVIFIGLQVGRYFTEITPKDVFPKILY